MLVGELGGSGVGVTVIVSFYAQGISLNVDRSGLGLLITFGIVLVLRLLPPRLRGRDRSEK
jgi:hypothetical protein